MCTPERVRHYRSGQSGLSLIELVMFIVIVSVGLAGILSVMNLTTRESADPLLRKQALAIGESLMEEIQLQPFTYCDPDDAATDSATGAGSCATAEGMGHESETRFGTAQFDNVNDYHGYSANPIANITGTAVPGYAASVDITQIGAGAIPLGDAGAALQITVRITGPSGTDVSLTGYRTRYAPNTGL